MIRGFQVLIISGILSISPLGATEVSSNENNIKCISEDREQVRREDRKERKNAKKKEIVDYDAMNYTTDEVPQDRQTLSKAPRFQNGDMNKFSMWVNQHLKYPASLRKTGIGGKVVAQFKINSDGRISDIKIISGITTELDNEVIRVLSSSPFWEPAIKDGKPVAVEYQFPVVFIPR